MKNFKEEEGGIKMYKKGNTEIPKMKKGNNKLNSNFFHLNFWIYIVNFESQISL